MQQAGDKRKLGRTRTILAAHAVIGKGLADVACQVKDMSDTGARISVERGAALPERFELRIPAKNVFRLAEVRWRTGPVVGIEFVQEKRSTDINDITARNKELEAENAELRRRLATMADRLYAYGDSERFAV